MEQESKKKKKLLLWADKEIIALMSLITITFVILDVMDENLFAASNQYSRILLWGNLIVCWVLSVIKEYVYETNGKCGRWLNYTLSAGGAVIFLTLFLSILPDANYMVTGVFSVPVVILQVVTGYKIAGAGGDALRLFKPVGKFIFFFTLFYAIVAIAVYVITT